MQPNLKQTRTASTIPQQQAVGLSLKKPEPEAKQTKPSAIKSNLTHGENYIKKKPINSTRSSDKQQLVPIKPNKNVVQPLLQQLKPQKDQTNNKVVQIQRKSFQILPDRPSTNSKSCKKAQKQDGLINSISNKPKHKHTMSSISQQTSKVSCFQTVANPQKAPALCSTPPQTFDSVSKKEKDINKSKLHEINLRKAFAAMGTDQRIDYAIQEESFFKYNFVEENCDQHATQQMIFETLDDFDNPQNKGGVSGSEEGENLFDEEEIIPNLIEQTHGAGICTTFRRKERHTDYYRQENDHQFTPLRHNFEELGSTKKQIFDPNQELLPIGCITFNDDDQGPPTLRSRTKALHQATEEIYAKLKIGKSSDKMKKIFSDEDDDEIADDDNQPERDQRYEKILSLRPQTNFDKFDNTGTEDLKERTNSIFSAEREPRKTIERKTMGTRSVTNYNLMKSRSPTQFHSRCEKLITTDHLRLLERKSSGPGQSKTIDLELNQHRSRTANRKSAQPPEPAFISFDADGINRDYYKLGDKSISQLQIQLAQKQQAVSGRNKFPQVLLNHSAVKKSYDAFRKSAVGLSLNQSLSKLAKSKQTESTKTTRTPAQKNPYYQQALLQSVTPSQKYQTFIQKPQTTSTISQSQQLKSMAQKKTSNVRTYLDQPLSMMQQSITHDRFASGQQTVHATSKAPIDFDHPPPQMSYSPQKTGKIAYKQNKSNGIDLSESHQTDWTKSKAEPLWNKLDQSALPQTQKRIEINKIDHQRQSSSTVQEIAGKIAQTWKALLGDKAYESQYLSAKKQDDDFDEILPTEHNPKRIEIKINPTKLAEKGWEDCYKLSILLTLQENDVETGELYTDQFGGVQIEDLNEAFAFRSQSNARHQSPQQNRSKSKSSNTMNSTQRLKQGSEARSMPSINFDKFGKHEDLETRPRLLSDENDVYNQPLMEDSKDSSNADNFSQEEESPASDRSQHFVFSTMKGLNKGANTPLDKNLLQMKLIEKKQFNLNQKHSSSIKPLLVLQQSVSRDKELINDIGMGIEMIAESPIIPVQKKQLFNEEFKRHEEVIDDDQSNSKMLDSQDFVLNNTMSSYVMNSHRDDLNYQSKVSDSDLYANAREFSESQINVNLESDANLIPMISKVITNTRAKVASDFFGEQYYTVRQDITQSRTTSELVQVQQAQNSIKSKQQQLRQDFRWSQAHVGKAVGAKLDPNNE